MSEQTDVVEVPQTRRDSRRAAIRGAAIEQFIARGYASTSMAHIAQAAGVSRPALYQYFSDKEDVFAAAFAGVFEELVDAAIEGLHDGEGTRQALDTMLQRYEGDLWELTESSPHNAELVEAKSPAVAAAVHVELERLWAAVVDFLVQACPGAGAAKRRRREEWLDVLRWSPRGLRADDPGLDLFRQRLSALARAVAVDVDAAS